MTQETMFKCLIEVPFHGSKKNGKTFRKNKATQKLYISSNDRIIFLQDWITQKLRIEKLKKRIDSPITKRMNAKFTFFFPESVYYTKKGEISERIPDLSNLYELPQDVLQNVDIIKNDTLIDSHDGSRRLPIDGTKYYLEIELTKI